MTGHPDACASIKEIPRYFQTTFPPQTFDIIVLASVIQYLPDLPELIYTSNCF
jgi:hypothetical protein